MDEEYHGEDFWDELSFGQFEPEYDEED